MNDMLGSALPIPSRECLVLNCTDDSGTRQWITKTSLEYWTVNWAVCSHHYWQLDDGEEFAAVTEQKPSTRRWLLMGDDLVIPSTPAEVTRRVAQH